MNPSDKFVLVGDRLLLKPKEAAGQTKSGLFLPPGVGEKEPVQSGFVLKAGPGYAVAPPGDLDEPWKETDRSPKYIPLQAEEGDLAIYLHKHAVELDWEGERYVIVPHHAVLMLIREPFS